MSEWIELDNMSMNGMIVGMLGWIEWNVLILCMDVLINTCICASNVWKSRYINVNNRCKMAR
jgi:hypothetical protein